MFAATLYANKEVSFILHTEFKKTQTEYFMQIEYIMKM